MKVLVTGATGFIGNHVIKYLLHKDIEVVATSKNEAKAREYAWINKVNYKELNIHKLDTDIDYFQYFDKPSKIIHLSWSGLPNYHELFHFEKNLMSNYFFLKNMIVNGLDDVTVTGTCLEYGLRNGELYESDITNPNNSYGLAKDSLRKFLQILSDFRAFKYRWIRLFYIYGEGQSPTSIISQLNLAIANRDKSFKMSKGEQLRDYLNAKAVACNICKIALQNSSHGIFNCCKGEPISIRNLVERHIREKNVSMELDFGYYPYPSYEGIAFWGNNDKLKKLP